MAQQARAADGTVVNLLMETLGGDSVKELPQRTLPVRSTGCTPAWEVRIMSRIDSKDNTDSKWSPSFKKKKS